MEGFVENIEKTTLENSFFRKVLYTSSNLQLVAMSLKPLEDIGMEVHETVDQFFRVEKGVGRAIINGAESALEDGIVVVVPAGANHNIINTSSDQDLKLYTIYSPPNHPVGRIHATKEEAEADEHNH